MFTDTEVQEFRTEALELIEAAEASLIELEGGAAFKDRALKNHYDNIFRAFQSVKGAAGLLGMDILHAHMHEVETILVGMKSRPSLTPHEIDFFFRALDAARMILDGKSVAFDYKSIHTETRSPRQPRTPEVKIPRIGPSHEGRSPDRVLIVEDDLELLGELGTQFVNTGLEVKTVGDPSHVIPLLKDFSPTVVLSDLVMPKLDGVGLIQKIRQHDAYIPVVFLSGHLKLEILLEAMQFGVFGAFEKPCDWERVIECVRSASRRYRLKRLVDKSMNLLIFQFADLDELLLKQGAHDMRNSLSSKISEILAERRDLADEARKKAS